MAIPLLAIAAAGGAYGLGWFNNIRNRSAYDAGKVNAPGQISTVSIIAYGFMIFALVFGFKTISRALK